MHTLQKREKALVESLSKGPVFSAENPGEWAGKEDKHIPVATAVENGVHGELTVTTSNGSMSLANPWVRSHSDPGVI